jgi:hypothetical protein
MPKSISMVQKREWLEQFERGITETHIAAKSKRDIRTVKKGLDEARRERVSSQARAELVKDAMQKHNDKLIKIVNELIPLLKLPSPNQEIPWEDQFISGEIKLDGMVARYGNLFTPNTISIVLDAEEKPEWELLKEHLKKDPLWLSLSQWKNYSAAHLESIIRLKLILARNLEKNTGLKFARDAISGSYLYSHSVSFLFKLMLWKLPRMDAVEEFEQNIRTDPDKGDIKYASSTILAHDPGKEDICRTNILKVVKQLVESEQAKEVVRTGKVVEEANEKAKRAANEIVMMGLVPGQCRICSRLGV